MFDSSKVDFTKIDMTATPPVIAREILEIMKQYWRNHLLNDPYIEASKDNSEDTSKDTSKDNFPLDSGYCDLHIAVLRCFLREKSVKNDTERQFYIYRMLMYLEIDPPSTFIDQGLLIK